MFKERAAHHPIERSRELKSMCGCIRQIVMSLHHLSAGQVPYDQVVYMANIASPRSAAERAPHGFEDHDLAAGKIVAGGKPAFLANRFAAPDCSSLRMDEVCARVLPDSMLCKAVHRSGIPDDGGLALVGDADRRRSGGLEIGLAARPSMSRRNAGISRVMLDPTAWAKSCACPVCAHSRPASSKT